MSPFPNLHKQTASSHERKPWKRIAKLGPNNLGTPVDGVKFVRDGVLGFGLGFGRGTHTYLSFPVCLSRSGTYLDRDPTLLVGVLPILILTLPKVTGTNQPCITRCVSLTQSD